MDNRPVIGIDPGLSGGIAVIEADNVRLEKMPVLVDSKTGRRHVCVSKLKEILSASLPAFVVLEKAQPMPRDGSMGSFRYGECFGTISAVVEMLGFECLQVHPATWKTAMQLKGATKDDSRAMATEIIGNPDAFHKKNSHNLAEALLLAQYGRKILSGEINILQRKKKGKK